MSHVIQVGAGSGGMPVLDLLCRDPRVTQITLIEPDEYKLHNVERHVFPLKDVGGKKAALAQRWISDRRPDLKTQIIICDVRDAMMRDRIDNAVAAADIGVCAADNEAAKYHWDALMRRHGKPWTLGEVLSGGIGGFVHWFVPGGPCYGCVASHLQRELDVDTSPAPDYSQPGGPVAATTIPASKAAIQTIASLHAVITLQLLADGSNYDPGFTTLLLPLQRVDNVFAEAFRPYRFRVPRAADCLICGALPTPSSVEELDVALDQALARLAHE